MGTISLSAPFMGGSSISGIKSILSINFIRGESHISSLLGGLAIKSTMYSLTLHLTNF